LAKRGQRVHRELTKARKAEYRKTPEYKAWYEEYNNREDVKAGVLRRFRENMKKPGSRERKNTNLKKFPLANPDSVKKSARKQYERYLAKIATNPTLHMHIKRRQLKWRIKNPDEVRRTNRKHHLQKWLMTAKNPIGPFHPGEMRRKKLEQVLKESKGG
jgi:hypothetical protein